MDRLSKGDYMVATAALFPDTSVRITGAVLAQRDLDVGRALENGLIKWDIEGYIPTDHYLRLMDQFDN